MLGLTNKETSMEESAKNEDIALSSRYLKTHPTCTSVASLGFTFRVVMEDESGTTANSSRLGPKTLYFPVVP